MPLIVDMMSAEPLCTDGSSRSKMVCQTIPPFVLRNSNKLFLCPAEWIFSLPLLLRGTVRSWGLTLLKAVNSVVHTASLLKNLKSSARGSPPIMTLFLLRAVSQKREGTHPGSRWAQRWQSRERQSNASPGKGLGWGGYLADFEEKKHRRAGGNTGERSALRIVEKPLNWSMTP